jgi:hypothetical protein
MAKHLQCFLSAGAAPVMLLFAVVSTANAADGCGPGCHATVAGACVVDGWSMGARVRNECPATSHPRPPCGGSDYIWSPGKRACIPKVKDWL